MNSLRRVLHAYAKRNAAVGYCQAMNYIAGILALLCMEELAFWLLCVIVEDMFPVYFLPSQGALARVDVSVLE
eukprot:CAMPEP_0177679830 /NCGR_PEP_ID=MMETSP0447-20121125/29828_1 /TAXON_ID=0 /ORGANISM="Stygamoeba regulata, Strain BSH-02190019" /LENGTH=72 /DNA_ID=CAMNT_0019189079 /DNA_START=80 /DNA_END=295 /DNA_ORIENTATION=-